MRRKKTNNKAEASRSFNKRSRSWTMNSTCSNRRISSTRKNSTRWMSFSQMASHSTTTWSHSRDSILNESRTAWTWTQTWKESSGACKMTTKSLRMRSMIKLSRLKLTRKSSKKKNRILMRKSQSYNRVFLGSKISWKLSKKSRKSWLRISSLKRTKFCSMKGSLRKGEYKSQNRSKITHKHFLICSEYLRTKFLAFKQLRTTMRIFSWELMRNILSRKATRRLTGFWRKRCCLIKSCLQVYRRSKSWR